MKSSWSDLPSELVIAIAGYLTEFTDHLRFRSVCSHWRSSFHSHSLRLPPQLPWLALPSAFSTHFYSLSEDRVYSNPPPNVSDNSNLFGSASGWFLSVGDTNTFSLINPFTGASIELPCPDPCWSLTFFAADSFVWDRSHSVVMAACSRRSGVYYCRLGEVAWASIESQQYNMARSITFYEGRFYILSRDICETVVLDGETLEEISIIDPPDMKMFSPFESHLFVSSGELLVLIKHYSDSQFYEVHCANFNDELVEWIEVDDIGDRALFVDNLHCFSVKVGDNGLLRRNCIYTAQWDLSCDASKNSSYTYSISMFDLGNNSCVERLEGALSKSFATPTRAAISSHCWILPSLS